MGTYVYDLWMDGWMDGWMVGEMNCFVEEGCAGERGVEQEKLEGEITKRGEVSPAAPVGEGTRSKPVIMTCATRLCSQAPGIKGKDSRIRAAHLALSREGLEARTLIGTPADRLFDALSGELEYWQQGHRRCCEGCHQEAVVIGQPRGEHSGAYLGESLPRGGTRHDVCNERVPVELDVVDTPPRNCHDLASILGRTCSNAHRISRPDATYL
jgi:hypothetical protein